MGRRPYRSSRQSAYSFACCCPAFGSLLSLRETEAGGPYRGAYTR